MELIEANWLVFALALVAVLLVAWWLLRRASTTPKRREHRPDVLDEGQAPAARNQALIDAAPAAIILPPPVSSALGGIAEVVAIGAQDVIEEAKAHAEPQPVAAPEPAPPPAVTTGDDLAKIKGLGPKLQALLPMLGITSYAQIAALDEAGLAELDGKLGAFAGRPAKDGWVEQARFLAAGDVAGFEARFGKV